MRLAAHRSTLPLMRRTVDHIERAAKHLAPRGDHRHGSGKTRRSRPLQVSITSRIRSSSLQISASVGSAQQHAATIHLGSKPHIIRMKGRVLKFRSDRLDFALAARAGRRGGNKRTGGFHYRVQVRHPGNKRPVRYLTTPLVQYGRANGFAVDLFIAGAGGDAEGMLPVVSRLP